MIYEFLIKIVWFVKKLIHDMLKILQMLTVNFDSIDYWQKHAIGQIQFFHIFLNFFKKNYKCQISIIF